MLGKCKNSKNYKPTPYFVEIGLNILGDFLVFCVKVCNISVTKQNIRDST